jgi:hypothetical protein
MVLTIKTSAVEELESQEKIDTKIALYFEEDPRGLVLNKVNGRECEKLFGSDDSDDWHGKKIELYFDPTVTMMGRTCGGIRVRQPS